MIFLFIFLVSEKYKLLSFVFFLAAVQFGIATFQSISIQANRKQLEKIQYYIKKDDFVVLWFGTVLPLQEVDIIMKAAKELRHNRKIKFYIIGKTEKLNIKRDKYENVEFLGWLQDDKIAKYINSADICLVGHFNLENPRANREIPGKAFIYKAMGQKIILGDSEANREVFKEDNKTIFYVERGNYKKLAEMIEKIYEAKL